MSKLLSLKEWITLDEAAGHLSAVFSERVSVVDIYRFALAGHLTISANFVNHGRAFLGKKLAIRDAGFNMVPGIIVGGDKSIPRVTVNVTLDAMPEFQAWVDAEPSRKEWLAADEPKIKAVLLEGVQFSASDCLQFNHEFVSTLEGVWDLTMVGSERIDIEHALQREIGGPAVELVNFEGVIVSKPDGTYAQLLKHFEENEYAGEDVQLRKWNDPSAYYPSGSLPKDAPLVVRPNALTKFIAEVSGGALDQERPVDERERATLLRMIRALEVMAKLPARGAAAPLEAQLQQLGFSKPGEATIRKMIELARSLEPDKAQ